MLNNKTTEIKELSLAVKSNFIQIGKILTEIRDKELYKEKYNSFTSYLESAETGVCRTMSYKLMKVYLEYGSVPLMEQVPFNRLVQLAYISDRDTRKDLEEKAHDVYSRGKDTKKFIKEIERTAKRITDTVLPGDYPECKCERQLKSILEEIKKYQESLEYLKIKINSVLKFSKRFPDNKTIQGLIDEVNRCANLS